MSGLDVLPENLKVLIDDAKDGYEARFQEKPDVCVAAPGRVNLIGEHVDYNDGYVLPMAVPLYTVVVGKKTQSTQCVIDSKSISDKNEVIIDLTQPIEVAEPQWANYVRGVMVNYQAWSGKVQGFNAIICSDVPLGGGLSSSASLEVAVCTFIEAIAPEDSPAISKRDKAVICQKAEHDFAGLPCGIMDQLVTILGQQGQVVLMDCRSLEVEMLPLSDPDIAILVTNSNVKHTLVGSEYSERKQMCDDVAKILNKPSLRDLSVDEFEDVQGSLEPVMCRRVRHVVTEIKRTTDAADALRNKDYAKFGTLMTDSHISLRNDYEVSCYELDQLVDLASSCDGVFGSRMTGGGFGGCTVSLLKHSAVKSVMHKIESEYTGKATFYICTPSEGARSYSI